MKNFQKSFNQPAFIVVLALLVIIGGVYFFKNKNVGNPAPGAPAQGGQTSTNNKKTAVIPNANFRNDCKELASYSPKAYQDGWVGIFKRENSLSDAEFNSFVSLTSVTLSPNGINCLLDVKYTAKKDWVVSTRVDRVNLGSTPSLLPTELPLEKDPATPSGNGVSTINFRNTLFFKSKAEALAYFVKAYNLQDTNARVSGEGFQYFSSPEGGGKPGFPFAGEGGEAFITVSGTLNSRDNKCYHGELSLVSKKTAYHNNPCTVN